MPVPQSRAEWQRRAAQLRYANGHFIDAEHVPARSARFTVVNPATAAPTATVAGEGWRHAIGCR
jgi:hypothetical protein